MRKLMLGIIVLILLVPVVYSLTISTVYSNAVGDRTVEINWTTDTEADSKVVYGKTTSLGEVEYSSARVQWHGVVLTGLEPDTEYYYGVESSDGLEVKYDSNDNNFYKFRTKEQILFANILPDNIGTDSAEIKWETNIDAGSLVRYGLSSSNLDKQASVDGKTKTHNVKLTGLQNGTTYFYNIISDYAEAGVRDFTTRVDVEPPVVYDFSVPEYYNKDIIDIKGTTKPSSEIFVYLEGRLIRQGTARSTGEFSFNYISLAKDVNKIKLRVVDPYGEVFEKEYTTTIDIVPPEVTLSKIPDALQTTTQTLTGTVNEPVSVTITINDKIVSFNTTEKISQTLAFVEGDNNLIVTVKDRAGNVYELKKKVYADSKNPTLTLTNPISSYDPSIGKNIRFKGTLSEPGDIFIKVNERTYKTSTTDNLSWEQVIELERKVETTGTISTTTEARAELSPEYQNTIEIYAVDRSGRESTKSSGTIRYKLCGTAGDWDVVIGKPNPGALSPFDLERGYGLVGFQIDLVWRGTGQGTVTGKPTLSAFTQVGSALRESYNLDMIGTVSSDFLKTKGYATIQMRKTDKFQELESLKFPLQIDIPYSYDEFGTAKAGRQQTCITVDVLVDKTFDESKIPENFVKSSINFLNKTIDVLDKMIDPLKKVEKFVFFGCKAMQIRNIFVKANEVKACYAFNNNIPQKTVGSKAEAIKDSQDCANVDKARMKAGAAGDPVSMCQSCMQAKISSEKAKHEMSLVCDRYTCPSVPTVQYYARVNAENEKKKLTKLYYSPGIGFSLKSNCDLVMLNNLIKDMKDGTINNKKDYEACEKEYEYLWGPGSLTQMTRIFESSAKLSAPKQSTFQTAGGGFFNSIASLCGKIKKRTEARKLWIDGREFSYNNGSWSVTDVIKVGASETEVKNIQSKAREITQLGDNFYYKYEADTNKLFTETATNFKGENLALSYVKNVQGEVAVDSKGVLYIKKKSTDGKKVWWQPDDTPRSLVSSTTGRPLILNQLRQEFERQENEGKYLIESTDGLMSSLQAVCVPGIISHLQNIKTISEQLRRCFQNLLINDEFTAGYCKSLISEHICDLVFNLIRCSFKMFESQPRTARPQAGVPGFFQALSAAGSSVNRDIKERYGNTVTFDAIFNERKLVHQMCLGAFNHDWDLNIETILEENRQKAVPIKPDIFLYPTEMRFYGFNPVTGRTNIMYHLGLGIVAGADMTYEVNLVCSNDNSCSSAMGFAGGRCDCSYENRGITKKNIARGTLTKGESNWDDPDKSDIRHLLKDSLYRYDKIEVKWQYRDAKNQLVTDTIVKDIALVGQMPDEGCKLDIISGEFRCLFGFGAQGYAKFVGDVQPLQSTFQVGDSIKFKGRIDKYSPDGETNRNVILRAEVRDSKGVRIDDTGGLLEFNLREDKRYYLESDFAEKGVPGYVIKQDDFKSESGLVTGVMRSTVSSSKFYKIYPTPYTALVSGDIGANNVIIKLLDSTYQVSTTSPVRGGTTGALTDPGKELKLYV
ncbi:fibronectin type III domain-containing protein, partial [Candidatus Woesearchaeota archaeon]|nr:fibronectin type III domain-containing protein [Candidatus Woesearchaeota archaeon]